MILRFLNFRWTPLIVATLLALAVSLAFLPYTTDSGRRLLTVEAVLVWSAYLVGATNHIAARALAMVAVVGATMFSSSLFLFFAPVVGFVAYRAFGIPARIARASH